MPDGDFFDVRVPAEWRDEAWTVIGACRNLDWLILSKRPQNVSKMLPANWGEGWPNVWLGTTTENQKEADRRLPVLLRIPAAAHFCSAEPLLDQIDLRPYLAAGFDWVIAGGESGAGARPMNLDWAPALRDQCREADAAFFMKQIGGVRDARDRLDDFPLDLRIRQFPR
jgi:protein gp37